VGAGVAVTLRVDVGAGVSVGDAPPPQLAMVSEMTNSTVHANASWRFFIFFLLSVIDYAESIIYRAAFVPNGKLL
jgi:hypothetical protein